MDKKHKIFSKIRDAIAKSPVGQRIASGEHVLQCKHFSSSIYDFLQKQKNAIDGLSLAVVQNMLDIPGHTWLVAFHEDTGYFMIDPSIGQFAKHKNGEPFHEAFIGSYNELEKKFEHHEFEFIQPDYLYYPLSFNRVWSPAIQFYGEIISGINHNYMNQKDGEIWNRYPLEIEFPAQLSEKMLIKKWKEKMLSYGVDASKELTDAGITAAVSSSESSGYVSSLGAVSNTWSEHAERAGSMSDKLHK